VARIKPRETDRASDLSCSVVIPCRNERGNIAAAVERVPEMGSRTEIIFVDGASTDGTREEIQAQIDKWGGRKEIRFVAQDQPRGKGEATWMGFAAARGDVLMILDADLTVAPEDLPKFFRAIATGKGEFINGTRLVYPMESQAMRTANLIGNKAFSLIFSWLLEQRITDTLCGTKVLRRRDYETIRDNRPFFGDFDPFGDFDLLFGAAKANLKIVELPIRYHDRTYGATKISRWRHGVLLLRMSTVAFRKLKLS
jgi:glycosyltransferase involved in cell wall biosynthesis